MSDTEITQQAKCDACHIFMAENENFRQLVSSLKEDVKAFARLTTDIGPVPNIMYHLLVKKIAASLGLDYLLTTTTNNSEEPVNKKYRLDLNETKTLSSSNSNDTQDDDDDGDMRSSFVDTTAEASDLVNSSNVPLMNDSDVEMPIDSVPQREAVGEAEEDEMGRKPGNTAESERTEENLQQQTEYSTLEYELVTPLIVLPESEENLQQHTEYNKLENEVLTPLTLPESEENLQQQIGSNTVENEALTRPILLQSEESTTPAAAEEEKEVSCHNENSDLSSQIIITPTLNKVELEMDHNYTNVEEIPSPTGTEEETKADSLDNSSITSTASIPLMPSVKLDVDDLHDHTLEITNPHNDTLYVTCSILRDMDTSENSGPTSSDFINLCGWVNIKYDKMTRQYLHYDSPQDDFSTGKSLLDLNNFLKATPFETSHLKRFSLHLDWANLGRSELKNFIHIHGHKITDLSLHGFVFDKTSIDVAVFQKLFIMGLPNLKSLFLSMTMVEKRRTERVVKQVKLPFKVQLLHLKFLTVQNFSIKFWVIPFILSLAPNLLVYESKRPLSYRDTQIVKTLTEMKKLDTLNSIFLEFHEGELDFLDRLGNPESKLTKIFMILPKSKDVVITSLSQRAKDGVTTSLSQRAMAIYYKFLDSNKGTLKEIVLAANIVNSDIKLFRQLPWPKLDNVNHLSVQLMSHQGRTNCQIPFEIQAIFPNLKTVQVKLTPINKLATSFSCPFLGVSESVESVLLSDFPSALVKVLRLTFPHAKLVQEKLD